MNVEEARALVCESGKRLLRDGLVAGTFGNISYRVDDSSIIITPSGISYDELTPGDMVLVNIHDLSCDENKKPSSEKDLHIAIYKHRREVNAVIHNHSLYASIVAAIGTEVLPYIEDTAMTLGPSIRVAKHAFTGSPELSNGALKALEDRFAAILQSHGAVCVGRDMKEAFTACHILEKSCQIYITVRMLGGGEAIPQEMAEKFRDSYLNRYQKK